MRAPFRRILLLLAVLAPGMAGAWECECANGAVFTPGNQETISDPDGYCNMICTQQFGYSGQQRRYGGSGGGLTPAQRAAIAEQKRIRMEQERRAREARVREARERHRAWQQEHTSRISLGREARGVRDDFRRIRDKALEDDPAALPPVRIVTWNELAPVPTDAAGQLRCAAAHARELRALVSAQNAAADLPAELQLGEAARIAGSARQVVDTGLARPGCHTFDPGSAPPVGGAAESARALERAIATVAEAEATRTRHETTWRSATERVRELETQIEARKRPVPTPAPVATPAPSPTPAPLPEDDPFLKELQDQLAAAKDALAKAEAEKTQAEAAERSATLRLDQALTSAEKGDRK